jgi:hypothetical protein
MYYVFIYEKRIMNPAEIVLRRGKRRDERERWGGVNLIKIYCKYILCKCHNVSPYTIIIC